MNHEGFGKYGDIYQKQSLDMLIPISATDKHSVQLKDGVWNSSEVSGVEWIPNDAPDSYKMFRRKYLSFMNKRATYENLFYGGGITPTAFKQAMSEMESAIVKLREFYSYPSVALLIVNKKDNPPVSLKLFGDEYLCNYYTKAVYNVTVEDINAKRVPSELDGTRIFEQEWYTSIENIVSRFPTIEQLSGVNTLLDNNLKV